MLSMVPLTVKNQLFRCRVRDGNNFKQRHQQEVFTALASVCTSSSPLQQSPVSEVAEVPGGGGPNGFELQVLHTGVSGAPVQAGVLRKLGVQVYPSLAIAHNIVDLSNSKGHAAHSLDTDSRGGGAGGGGGDLAVSSHALLVEHQSPAGGVIRGRSFHQLASSALYLYS